MIETVHAKLVGKKDGIYTIYVFETDSGHLCMCTKLPNWGIYHIKIGDTGFLSFEIAQAGEKYYDRNSGIEKTYLYTNVYFKDFIKDNYEKEQIIL